MQAKLVWQNEPKRARAAMINTDADLREDLRPRRIGARISRAARRILATSEGSIVGWALAGFVFIWTLYDTVSLLTVDLRWDASEASLWAQHLGFGYKHPPMTAWLFAAWFAVFPHADWAAHLQAVTIVAITLAITWRLNRDHLDEHRTLFGLSALLLIPFYTFKAAELNANTVMMPFWAAALLFYLRARRGLGVGDALLAGAFSGLTLLGKYWAIYLIAGMAVASVAGAGARRFWSSPAPHLMAAGAVVVIAPHFFWYVSHAGGASYAFVRDSVMTGDPIGRAPWKSIHYLLSCIAYTIGPLILLAALRPSRAAIADMVWPADADRQQATILFAVPLILPALVNIIEPHRLTADWTFPNWALLPVVLYGSPKLAIDVSRVAIAGLFAVAFSLLALIASPVVAYQKLKAGPPANRPNARLVAEAAKRVADKPIQLYWGSDPIIGGFPFYLPNAHPIADNPLSDAGRAAIKTSGLLIACLDTDTACLNTGAALASPGIRSADLTIRHTFLGFSGPPMQARIVLVPPSGD